MDEFIVEHTLYRLQKQIDENKASTEQYQNENDNNLDTIDTRLDNLESSETEITGTINSLRSQLNDMQEFSQGLLRELNKTKLVNIKQDLMIRTINNLREFEAYDMFTDTFVTGDAIDWEKSVRGEFFPEDQAVGKTNQAMVVLEQTVVNQYQLISQDGSSDQGVAQSFISDKTRPLDRIGLNLGLFNENVFQPLIVSICEAVDGSPLAQVSVAPSRLSTTSEWIEIEMPNIHLVENEEYYIRLNTDDPHGYKVGYDMADNYLAGTSFSLYNNVWIDSNYDIGFRIWAFPADDEIDAMIVTLPREVETQPQSIVFDVEEVNIEGGVNYYVSRDGGGAWKILQPGRSTSLDDLPSGNSIVIRAHIMKDSRINAWGYVITRSDAS